MSQKSERRDLFRGGKSSLCYPHRVTLYISLVLPSMNFLVSLSSSLIHSLKVESRI